MKLHLSKSLRKAILATFAVLSPLTLSTSAAYGDETTVGSSVSVLWDANWEKWLNLDPWSELEAIYNPAEEPDVVDPDAENPDADTPTVDTPTVDDADTPTVDTPTVNDADTPTVDTPTVDDTDTPTVDTPTVDDTDTPTVDDENTGTEGGIVDNHISIEAFKPVGENKTGILPVRQLENVSFGMNNHGGYYFDQEGNLLAGPPVEGAMYAVAVNGVTGGSTAKYNNVAGGGVFGLIDAENPSLYSVYVDVSGTLEAVAGGHLGRFNTSNVSWGQAELTDEDGNVTQNAVRSDHFVVVRDGASVGIVAGVNITPDTRASVNYGDSFVSIYTNLVSDSVAGRMVDESSTNYGDAYVFIYNVLDTNSTVSVHSPDASMGSVVLWANGTASAKVRNGVSAGSYMTDSSSACTVNGNGFVVVDLSSCSRVASFTKSLSGGSKGVNAHNQVGDAGVFINEASNVSNFASAVSGQSQYVINSDWTGTSGVAIISSSTTFSGAVVGANFTDATGGFQRANYRQDGNSYVVITDSPGATFSSVVCGSNVYLETSGTNDASTQFFTDEEKFLQDEEGVPLWFWNGEFTDENVPSLMTGGFTEPLGLSMVRTADSKSIVLIDGGTFSGRVVGGDYLSDTDTLYGGFFTQGDSSYYIRHYSFRSSIGETLMQISGGTFRNTVQGGTYVNAQNYGGYAQVQQEDHGTQEFVVGLAINKINMELTGGTYAATGTSILGGFDVTDTQTGAESTDYMTSVVCAYVGEINISMQGVQVDGEIIGGSHNQACFSRDNNGTYAIHQGTVTVRLLSGTFNGNVYAAGFYDTSSGRYTSTAPIYTEEVVVEIGKEAILNNIAISGGYKTSLSANTATRKISVVNGSKTLRFSEAGSYTNLSNVEFTNFNVIDVVDSEGFVYLDQALQTLYNDVSNNEENRACSKVGAGSLCLTNSHASSINSFSVDGGTLILPNNSSNYQTGLAASLLKVASGATLDISLGNCGTRGLVSLNDGSRLKVSSGQVPTVINSVNWGLDEEGVAGGKVSIVLSNAISTGGKYTIQLFRGLSTANLGNDVINGVTMQALTDLGLPESGFDGAVSGVRADSCVTLVSSNGEVIPMSTAYLILDEKGVLSLTTQFARKLYWVGGVDDAIGGGGEGDGEAEGDGEGGEGGEGIADVATWNTNEWNTDTHFRFMPKNPAAAEAGVDPSLFFCDGDSVFFVDFNGLDRNVIINSTVAPSSVYVETDITLNGDGDGVLDLTDGSLVVGAVTEDGPDTAATLMITENVTLRGSANSTVITLLSDSNLVVLNDSDLNIFSLNNGGAVTVAGSLSISNTVLNGGDLSVGSAAATFADGDALPVAKNLTLGADATFDNLTVTGRVKLSSAANLIVNEVANIGTISGGSLVVKDQVFLTTVGGKSSLLKLSGSGDLFIASNSVLSLTDRVSATGSTIGNISAVDASVRVSNGLTVTGTLAASKVVIDSLGLGSITTKVKANTLDCVDFAMDKSAASDIHFVSGGTYVIVEGENISAPLAVNEKQQDSFSCGRYDYSATVKEKQILLEVTNAIPDYYHKNAVTENGKSAANSLDSLFLDGSVEKLDHNGALASVIIAMDTLIEAGKVGAADELATAAAGASNAALGCAFSDDVSRQLKAIRNRTTTMGVSDCETHEGMPLLNAWVNAEGNYHKLDSDGTFAGYTLSSWGGTVGCDIDFTNHLTAGLAITAMYGDYTSDACDNVKGDFDTLYATVFARYAARAWVHTLVATFGRADVSVNRTVSAEGVAYRNKGDASGSAFGLMYEVGRVFAVNEDASACIQPVCNITFTKSSLSRFTESGTDAAVETGDLEMSRFVIGAGARLQGVVGTTLYNRTSIMEGRILVKANLGDDSCEAKNRFVAGGVGGAYKSAEQGSVGVEFGVGVTVPVGSESSSIFADFSAEVNSGYSNLNGTVGYRVNF